MEKSKVANISHAKKKWSKANLYLFSVSEASFKGHDVVFYMSKRKVHFLCFNPAVLSVLENTLLKEKVKIWFSAESRLYNEKWYTNLVLKHIEVPRLIELEKAKEQIRLGTFNFRRRSEDDF